MDVLIPGLIVGGVGLVFGLVLAVADRWLRVEEDPRLEILEGMLPGSNCGACGEPGCRAFAEKVLRGDRAPGGCSVSSPAAVDAIAAFLGVDAGTVEKRVARLHCGGGLGRARRAADYEGTPTCRAAHLVQGGGLRCSWGCLGLGDCDVACTFEAIHMNARRLPVVDVDRCTACGDCVEACPRDLFEILPLGLPLLVQCKAPLAGEEARALCSAACDACGLCARDAAPGLIRMVDGLPVVDTGAAAMASPEATRRCPTGAIRWVPGGQFADERETCRA